MDAEGNLCHYRKGKLSIPLGTHRSEFHLYSCKCGVAAVAFLNLFRIHHCLYSSMAADCGRQSSSTYGLCAQLGRRMLCQASRRPIWISSQKLAQGGWTT
jgi:hypothetical protein